MEQDFALRFKSFIIFILVCISQTAFAIDRQFSAHTALSLNFPSSSFDFRVGYQKESLSYLFKAEWNPWLNLQALNSTFEAGVINVGAGLEYRYFEGRCRSGFFVGPSVLLFDTALDERGSVGFFVDVIPVALTWPLKNDWSLRIEPSTLHLVVPVLTGIPLIAPQYRHGVALEKTF